MTKLKLIFLCGLAGAAVFLSAAPSHAKELRLVSIAPGDTEILFALGLGDSVVGVSSFCDYPPEALAKEKVGTFSQPSVEKILSLKPDWVFGTGLEQAAAIGKLKSLGLQTFVCDPSSFDELFSCIRDIGKLTDKETEAKNLGQALQKRIGAITTKTRNIPDSQRPKVFVEMWGGPLSTVSKGTFLDEMITTAGGVNIAHDGPHPYSDFSSEQVIHRNPDVILLAYMNGIQDAVSYRKRMGWDRIKAVKNNRIIKSIAPEILLRPGPRLVDALELLYQELIKP